MFTIDPPPRSCIPGSTACVTASVPIRFTPITRSHISGVEWTKNPNASVPALFTRMSMSPICPTAALIDSFERTSSS